MNHSPNISVDSLTNRDRGIIAFQAMLRGVPYIGATLEHFIFGPAAERRQRRVEDTLREIGERLQVKNLQASVASEEYVGLLEDTLPALARSINEDKRTRFRNLLFHAACLPSGNPKWDEAVLSRELLEVIDPPGLALLAAVARCPQARVDRSRHAPVPNVHLIANPEPQIVLGDIDYDTPPVPNNPVGYEWTVVEEWVHRLRAMRLLMYHTGYGAIGFGGIHLTHLGGLLVRWIIEDDVTIS